ncbi:hypothetical protein M0813_02793 [Anaeramoeba flamelloides]|uniref:Uncharacterized protein n=1 Tax=Anaeramoeba flamelloides TaxID=1746091 RepID=A0ABQ8YEE5_9EUKA|nr:hypothetical protein M0813_02793 [Anaeramoeba flamelloides]
MNENINDTIGYLIDCVESQTRILKLKKTKLTESQRKLNKVLESQQKQDTKYEKQKKELEETLRSVELQINMIKDDIRSAMKKQDEINDQITMMRLHAKKIDQGEGKTFQQLTTTTKTNKQNDKKEGYESLKIINKKKTKLLQLLSQHKHMFSTLLLQRSELENLVEDLKNEKVLISNYLSQLKVSEKDIQINLIENQNISLQKNKVEKEKQLILQTMNQKKKPNKKKLKKLQDQEQKLNFQIQQFSNDFEKNENENQKISKEINKRKKQAKQRKIQVIESKKKKQKINIFFIY